MRYACLVYIDPHFAFDGSAENLAVLDEAEAYRQKLVISGTLSEALDLASAAVTVRIRNARMSRSDGPFLETKEMLAGFVLVEADSIEDAIELASVNPMAKLGAVEVRPLVDFTKPRPVL